jgi:hypothetical protein
MDGAALCTDSGPAESKMKKRSPFDPDGDPDRGSDGNPASNGIEATRQQARIEHFRSIRKMLQHSAEWHLCASRGRVSALTSVRLNQVSGEIYGE